MAEKGPPVVNWIVKSSIDGEKLSRGRNENENYTNLTTNFENPIFSSIATQFQETRKTKVKILTPIEEMFLARESTMKGVNEDLQRTQKVKQKYAKGNGKQETKYKRFKNRVMPLNEEGEVKDGIRKKTKSKEKKKESAEKTNACDDKSNQGRFASFCGFFDTLLRTRREWKPKKTKDVGHEIDKDLDASEDRVSTALVSSCTPSYISNRNGIAAENVNIHINM